MQVVTSCICVLAKLKKYTQYIPSCELQLALALLTALTVLAVHTLVRVATYKCQVIGGYECLSQYIPSCELQRGEKMADIEVKNSQYIPSCELQRLFFLLIPPCIRSQYIPSCELQQTTLDYDKKRHSLAVHTLVRVATSKAPYSRKKARSQYIPSCELQQRRGKYSKPHFDNSQYIPSCELQQLQPCKPVTLV